ncbi:protein EFR3 homolog isoform X2 [Myiozetetes cayanensis]|uniref:protein EFR3 homolog isoform X2 n=2 Tax=Myiozetetes cayanensis TaxID=478635 RepID=UPI00215F44B9|nr:protein EFR3 homolog isoform X2 [Myiozetetes cayanensis]
MALTARALRGIRPGIRPGILGNAARACSRAVCGVIPMEFSPCFPGCVGAIPMEFSPCFPGVCGCCGALRPRYKRLVDNIFPEDPEDGLVKTNMEKLTFYALSAPEKLDRIGAYLSERLIRDVGRHRYGHVCIAMEALDQLLMACHCQSINLFVESFLKMVAKLLESDKPNLQILGTNSVSSKSQPIQPGIHREKGGGRALGAFQDSGLATPGFLAVWDFFCIHFFLKFLGKRAGKEGLWFSRSLELFWRSGGFFGIPFFA